MSGRRNKNKKRRQDAANPPTAPRPREPILHQFSVTAQSFTGPIPHPDILIKYNDVVPGGAERVFASWEGQTAHRQGLETRVITWDIRRANAGLVAGFLVAMTGIVGGIYLIVEGYSVEGLAFAGTMIASVVGTFVYGTRTKRDDLAQLRDEVSRQ